MTIRNCKTIEQRRKLVEKITGLKLTAISVYPKGLEAAQNKNCENMIGSVQIPVGIAGPVKIKGENIKGEYYIPLATTEGALVASVNRGCKALTISAGINVMVENIGITRGPVFETESLKECKLLENWLDLHKHEISSAGESTSLHLKLLRWDTRIIGRNLFVRFYFDTLDAMGMNMATFATQKIVELIESETQTKCISLAGNFDTDKKPSWLNFLYGRGKKVWAECIIPAKIVGEILKTTPEQIHKIAVTKCLIGSAVSGSLGFNAHFGNIIAAIFLATGQDAAHITEGSLGITSTDIVNGDLYFSVYLPDLVLGTVGGGTGLPSQKEALKILGINGGNCGKNAMKLAQITAAGVLAGELSLLASLAEGSLAEAHITLGR